MRIRAKVVLAFLTVSLCGIILVGYFSFKFAKEQLITVRGEKLTALVSNQKQDLRNILLSWKDRVRLIASRTQLRISFLKYLENGEEQHLSKMKKILKDATGAVRKVEHISMYNPEGKKIVSVGQPLVAFKMFEGLSFSNPDKDILDHVWLEGGSSKLYVSFSGPIFFDGRKVGVIQVILKADELLDIVKNYNGLGETGETLVAKRSSNGSVQYITPVRFKEKSGARYQVSSVQSDVAINKALARKAVFFKENIIDYRGMQVLAATDFLPELNWGIVVKIDKAEVLAVINQLFYTILGLVLIIAVFTVFAGVHFGNLITQPILALSLIAEKVREGDLSQRANVSSKDEVGHLSETFNEMVSALSDKTIELEEFVFRSAHDLRSPLVSCISLLNYIEKDVRDGDAENALDNLKEIKTSLSESQTLIADLLALTKLKSSEEPSEPLNVEGLIDSALNKFKHMDNFDRLDIQKDIRFEDELMAKKSRIMLIIDNLISNAVKYQDTREEHSFLKISIFQDADTFVLEVADNGLGIPKEQQDKIFSMFKRFHPKTSFGSGLGLYMMKKSADILKGELSFRDPGKGAAFSLRVPCVPQS